MKCFQTERGLASHFDKSPGCAQAIMKVLQCLPTQQPSHPLALARQTQTANGSSQTDNESYAFENDAQSSDTNDVFPFDDMDTDEANLVQLS